MSVWFIVSFVIVSVGSPPLEAQETRKLVFQSTVDRFELTLTGDRGSVDGKPADLTGLKDLLPVLTGDVANACPETKGRPDLTVRDGAAERTLFFKAAVVRQGKNCIGVSGDGLYFAPLHRDFLIGPKFGSNTVGPTLELVRDQKNVANLRREGADWVSADAGRHPNEQFFRRFVDSIAKYQVRQRASLAMAESKKSVAVKTAGRTLEFFRVTEGSWALKKAQWLEISDDWSFWYDLDDQTLGDAYAQQIADASDTARSVEERLGLIRRLSVTWSGNLRNLFRAILLEPNVDPKLSAAAMQRFKRKPSRDTAAVMLEVLESTQPDSLKREAASILKLQNPKGPKYLPESSPAERARVIQFWREWLEQAGT